MIIIKRFLINGNLCLCLILSFIIFSSLYSSDIFIYKSLTPYFFYLTGVTILLIYAGWVTLFSNKHELSLSGPVVLTLLLGLYVLIHGLFLSRILNTYHYYLIANCCFLTGLFLILKVSRPDVRLIFMLIIIAAVAESAICLLQYFKIVNSLNNYFAVTGSWENPNVTAMFIAMAVPSVFVLYTENKRPLIKLANFLLVLFIITLLTIKCRTAFIGSITAIVIILNSKYQLFQKAWDKKNRSAVILIAVVLFAVIFSVMNYAYQAKKASADGRKLIWKISTEMAMQKPLLGYGYGSFERNYNLFQSRYFEAGNGTPDEIQNAGFVRMGYNELIQNMVEGGFIGLLLFGGILLSLLLTSITTKEKKNYGHTAIAYAGIVAFIIMSLFNFSIQGIPVMCLFVIYSAITAVNAPELFSRSRVANTTMAENRPVKGMTTWIYGTLLIMTGTGGLYLTVLFIHDNLLNKQAQLLTKQGNYQQSLNILGTLSPRLDAYESYWNNYGNTLLANKDYSNAIIKFNKAALLTSDPKLYTNMAICYEQTGDYTSAKDNLVVAQCIEPNLFLPRYKLMNLYFKMDDTVSTLKEAQNIMQLVAKIPSRQIVFIKYKTSLLMEELGHPYNARLNKKPLTRTFYFSHKNI
jgi:O-antigen polymerase